MVRDIGLGRRVGVLSLEVIEMSRWGERRWWRLEGKKSQLVNLTIKFGDASLSKQQQATVRKCIWGLHAQHNYLNFYLTAWQFVELAKGWVPELKPRCQRSKHGVAGIPVPSYNSAGIRGGTRGPCPPSMGDCRIFFPEVTRPEGLSWSGGGGLWTGVKGVPTADWVQRIQTGKRHFGVKLLCGSD